MERRAIYVIISCLVAVLPLLVYNISATYQVDNRLK